jgi:nucleoside-diphosphate-sugar epimerase
MRYLVTGATGLVGSHLVDRLLSQGSAVRVLVRRTVDADAFRARGAEARLGDLADADAVPAAVDGVDVVVHSAGVVQVRGQHRDLWAVNVDGTERLLAASVQAGLGRFVHISTVAVYAHTGAPMPEDAPKRPAGAYGKSKWAAEEALWRRHADQGLPAVALRPCVVYGGRDRHAWPTLSRLAKMRFVPLPAGGARLFDLVHVSDVVDAIVAAAVAPAAAGRAYNVTDGESHSYRDILTALGRLVHRPPAIVAVPSFAWRLAARLVPAARALDLDLHYPIDAAGRDLGYRPRVGLAEGLERTFREMRDPATGST